MVAQWSGGEREFERVPQLFARPPGAFEECLFQGFTFGAIAAAMRAPLQDDIQFFACALGVDVDQDMAADDIAGLVPDCSAFKLYAEVTLRHGEDGQGFERWCRGSSR